MQRIPVTSTNITSIGHDKISGTLEVEFNTGDVYQYFNVPEYLHQQFMIATSKGQFLDDRIKYHYRYQKVS